MCPVCIWSECGGRSRGPSRRGTSAVMTTATPAPVRPQRPLAPWWARILIGAAVCGALGAFLLDRGRPRDERAWYFMAFGFLAPAATSLAADLDRRRPRVGLAALTAAPYFVLALATGAL